MNINLESVKDAIGIAGFALSLFLLLIHLKNRRTQLRSYWIAREAYRSSSIQLMFVESEQLANAVLFKLVLFNPGSIAAIINSFSVKKRKRLNFIQRLMRLSQWKSIDGSKWWPTQNAEDRTIKYLADEYQSLYVEDQRIIFCLIPGMIDREEYQFEIKTTNGGRLLQTITDSTQISFAHDSKEWFTEK